VQQKQFTNVSKQQKDRESSSLPSLFILHDGEAVAAVERRLQDGLMPTFKGEAKSW
jgi:hypothetical protein